HWTALEGTEPSPCLLQTGYAIVGSLLQICGFRRAEGFLRVMRVECRCLLSCSVCNHAKFRLHPSLAVGRKGQGLGLKGIALLSLRVVIRLPFCRAGLDGFLGIGNGLTVRGDTVASGVRASRVFVAHFGLPFFLYRNLDELLKEVRK